MPQHNVKGYMFWALSGLAGFGMVLGWETKNSSQGKCPANESRLAEHDWHPKLEAKGGRRRYSIVG